MGPWLPSLAHRDAHKTIWKMILGLEVLSTVLDTRRVLHKKTLHWNLLQVDLIPYPKWTVNPPDPGALPAMESIKHG